MRGGQCPSAAAPSYHRPEHPYKAGTGLLRLIVTVVHGKVMPGSQQWLEFAVPNATAEHARRDGSTQFYESHSRQQPRDARGADTSWHPAPGLGSGLELGFGTGRRTILRGSEAATWAQRGGAETATSTPLRMGAEAEAARGGSARCVMSAHGLR